MIQFKVMSIPCSCTTNKACILLIVEQQGHDQRQIFPRKTVKKSSKIEDDQMFKKQIKLTLMFIALVCLSFQPVSASGSLKQVNVTEVSDLNQIAGKDIISLVETNRLDISNINNKPVFNVIWNPDGSQMLIDASLFLLPKGGGDFNSSLISALYIANANGSDVKRVAWGESSYSGSKSVTAPVWSHSGAYFAYMELSKERMYRVTSSQLIIMSSDMQLTQQVELDPEMIELESDPSNFKYSPTEDKIAALMPGNLIIYDLEENTNLVFNLPDDTADVENMEWSPDGEKIVFIQNICNIIIVDIEKRELNQIYSAEHVGMYDAQWSPDSNKLIFYEISGSEEDGTLNYDIYAINDSGGNPEKIAVFDSGSSRVIQWYPDSEKLLVKKRSDDDTYALYSLSIIGKMGKLIEGNHGLDGMVGPNGYILATDLNPSYRVPPYIKTSNLFLFNELDKLTIENVTYHTWKGTDLLFVKDNEISVLNTSTHDIQDIPLPVKNYDRINVAPSGRFIAVDNNIFGFYEQGHSINITAGNDMKDNSGGNTTEETSNYKDLLQLLQLWEY
ncbi:hypothetical protein [Methanococcoides burtonii]|uniref:Uncharacterized protein n=1 Tax=Methanococcoides burtonii (strain DSM 6242 / NBRC 107633 / OCM 468 / ACE-M) TaxID=259564 RepID=Q12V95_METBU|nr:Hypothetical protein Mbur_1741 [Methanococcoides burtonii DSM 6242]